MAGFPIRTIPYHTSPPKVKINKAAEFANPTAFLIQYYYFTNLNFSKSKLLPGRKANETFCLPAAPVRSNLRSV